MRRAGLAAAALAALACAAPIIESRVHQVDPPALRRVAVTPFLPGKDFRGSEAPDQSGAAAAADAAALVTRFATEAFADAGFEVIPASDVAHAFSAQGKPVPHGDLGAFAAFAASEFGATAILSGEVYRYRERQGGELGATQAASVGYTLALHAAPGGRPLWTGRFDHTQRAVSEDLFRARIYPGAGSRWLSAAELSRWGARAAAERVGELR